MKKIPTMSITVNNTLISMGVLTTQFTKQNSILLKFMPMFKIVGHFMAIVTLTTLSMTRN